MRFGLSTRRRSAARDRAILAAWRARMMALAAAVGALAIVAIDGVWAQDLPPQAPAERLPAQTPVLPTGYDVSVGPNPAAMAAQAVPERGMVGPSAQGKAAPAEALPLPVPLPPAPLPPSTPLPPGGVTLDQAIELCLRNDPRIRVGLETIEQSRADVLTASLAPNPELNVGGTLLPLSRPITPQEPGGPSELDVGLNYSLDWFLFGKRAAAVASASLGVCVSEAAYADLVRQRVTETAVAFYDLLEAKASLELARADIENLERVEAVTQKAVENGGRPQVELSRVRLELLGARRTQRDAQATLVAAKAKLGALLGGAAADPAFEIAGTLEGPLTAEPLPVEESFAAALQNRPDVLALRRKVSQAQADVVVERRNALPELKSGLGLGHQYQQPIGVSDMTTWNTAVTMTVPLFNRNQGNRAKAASLVSQSNYELQSGLIELHAEIQQAVQALHTARQNAASVAEDELRLAAQVRDSIRKAYEVGGRPLIDVLDAQRNFRETYRLYITSRADYWRSLHTYNSAIGKQVVR